MAGRITGDLMIRPTGGMTRYSLILSARAGIVARGAGRGIPPPNPAPSALAILGGSIRWTIPFFRPLLPRALE